jgi:hypothetical protein
MVLALIAIAVGDELPSPIPATMTMRRSLHLLTFGAPALFLGQVLLVVRGARARPAVAIAGTRGARDPRSRWRSASTHRGLALTVPCVGASRIRVLGSAPLRTGLLVFNTRTLRRNQYPRVRGLQNTPICRPFDAGGGTRTPDTRIMIGWTQGPEGSDKPSQTREGDLSSPGSRELGAKSGAKSRRERKRRKSSS